MNKDHDDDDDNELYIYLSLVYEIVCEEAVENSTNFKLLVSLEFVFFIIFLILLL